MIAQKFWIYVILILIVQILMKLERYMSEVRFNGLFIEFYWIWISDDIIMTSSVFLHISLLNLHRRRRLCYSDLYFISTSCTTWSWIINLYKIVKWKVLTFFYYHCMSLSGSVDKNWISWKWHNVNQIQTFFVSWNIITCHMKFGIN